MTTQPDLYIVLGVARDATREQITRAYRALLRRYHPDTRDAVPDPRAADAALRQVVAAYAELGNLARRASYDRQHRPVRPTPAPAPVQVPVRVQVQTQVEIQVQMQVPDGEWRRPSLRPVRPLLGASLPLGWRASDRDPGGDPIRELLQALLDRPSWL